MASSGLIPPQIKTGTPEEFAALTRFLSDVANTLNGGIRVGENTAQKSVAVVFQGAGDELPIEHNLGRVPEGFTVSKNPDGAVISNTVRRASETRIYLKSSVANAKVTLLFF
jgi:hypothetical protein